MAQMIAAGEDGRAYVVELLARPGKPDPDIWHARREAFKATEDLAGEAEFIERAADRADAIIREKWADVELVRATLLRYGRLSPVAVEELLTPA